MYALRKPSCDIRNKVTKLVEEFYGELHISDIEFFTEVRGGITDFLAITKDKPKRELNK